jgi:vacuolar-type H+-ATPase subunit I/STV1
MFGAGLLYFVFAKCSLGILSVLIGLVLMLIGYLLLKKWERDCCVELCDFLKELAAWLVLLMAIASFLVAYSICSGCVYTLFTIAIPVWYPPYVINISITTYAVAATVTTWFTLYVLHKC